MIYLSFQFLLISLSLTSLTHTHTQSVYFSSLKSSGRRSSFQYGLVTQDHHLSSTLTKFSFDSFTFWRISFCFPFLFFFFFRGEGLLSFCFEDLSARNTSLFFGPLPTVCPNDSVVSRYRTKSAFTEEENQNVLTRGFSRFEAKCYQMKMTVPLPHPFYFLFFLIRFCFLFFFYSPVRRTRTQDRKRECVCMCVCVYV